MTDTELLLQQIEQLGYTPTVLKEGKTLALVAEPNVNIDPAKRGPNRARQIVRVHGTDASSRYQAARQLAVQCGLVVD